MRLLRLVGPGEDGRSLILETVDASHETEQFRLPVDERLRTTASADLPRFPVAESEAAKAPTPREIQTRVRAGETAEQVAEQAGIPVERVMRFAYPVLAERVRVTDEARRARARGGLDGQLVPFGELVDVRLSRHGVDPATVSWDAYRRPDGGWTVTAALSAQGRQLQARFSFALLNRTVSALDDVAADLLSDRPVQALLPPQPEPVFDDEPVAPVVLSAVPDPASVAAAPPAAGSAVPPAAAHASSTTAPSGRLPGRRQRAHTRSVPVDAEDELFDQDALDVPWHEPPLPLDLGIDAAEPGSVGEPAAEAAEPTVESDADLPHRRARRGEKPRMPSWDDILLGVRHKSE